MQTLYSYINIRGCILTKTMKKIILLPITKTQKLILLIIYKFRYVTAFQLQKYFIHNDSHRIKEWLKDLKEKNYLGNYSQKQLVHNLLRNTLLWLRSQIIFYFHKYPSSIFLIPLNTSYILVGL